MGLYRVIRSRWTIAVGLVGVIAAGTLWVVSRSPQIENRVYSIGWAPDPPFQEVLADGAPGGFIIDLVREAAGRRGIRLQWIRKDRNSEQWVRTGQVDLWPLMVITAERRKHLHITQPYFSTQQCYLVPASSRFHQLSDLTHSTIAYRSLPIDSTLVRELTPHAHLVEQETAATALEQVCLHHADAAFLNEHVALSTLLEGSACSSTPFRLISAGRTLSDGIASTFSAAPAADAIRHEIGIMATEGKLAGVLSHSGYFSGQVPETIENTLRAEQHERSLTYVVLGMCALLLLTLWQAFRVHRERDKARHASDALREAEQRYRTMIETAPDGILICDGAGIIMEANSALCKQTGYERQAFAGMLLSELLTDAPLPQTDSMAENGSDTSRLETCQRCADGSQMPVELGIRRVYLGGKLAFLAVIRDIVERKQAEQQRSLLEERLRQAQQLESVGRLAGGMAHDFNNLLTVINGYSSTLVKTLNPGDRKHRQAGEILAAGEKAADLIRQLLAFSRKQVMHSRPVSLNEVVQKSGDSLRRLVPNHIRLSIEFEDSAGWAMADPAQISQVLANLVINACDAMPDGGTVTVSTGSFEFARPQGEAPAGSYVCVTVADTGKGIEPEAQKHLFEPFFTTKGMANASGLGLATVYGIVRQCGGRIDVESAPERGSRFRLSLPRIAAPAQPAEDAENAVESTTTAETILVVEDQEEVRTLMADALRGEGYRLIEAASGDDALALAEKFEGIIHLLVTDVVMPGMSGRQLAKHLQPLRPQMKVLYVSGYSAELIAHHGVSENAAYLPKPFLASQLIGKVRSVLSS
jgi:two-component system cell cycle sensor histidine kinase/response regulator CckA